MLKTYVAVEQPSKPKLIAGISVSILWAFAVSFAYGVIIAVSPLVYFNVFITAGFGIFLGFGVRMLTKVFSITQKKIAVRTALACGIVGVYFSWVVYILYFLTEEGALIESYFLHPFLVFKPAAVVNIMMEMNQYGMWAIFGIVFKGWILTIVWIIEAGVIVVVSTLLVKNQPQSPFSLTYNKWYKKYILIRDFESIGMKEPFKQELAENPVESIKALGNGKAYHFARVSIYYLKEENDQYITVENVRKDREGKSEDSIEVIHLLTIKREEAKKLIEEFHGKKAFIFDY